MEYLSTDHLIVYAFLLITLAIGLWAGRGIKDIKEYALGNRQFGTMALVLTFLATDVGGQATINISADIIVALTFLSIAIAFIIQGLFIVPNLVHFHDCVTMGDLMGRLYGKNSKIITGVLGFFTTICVVGMELTVLGMICESMLGFDYRWGILIGGTLLACYSAYGGIKSVVLTDGLQFVLLLFVLPIITSTALKHIGGITELFARIPSDNLRVINHPNFSYYLIIFLSFSLFHLHIIDPAPMQRFLMGKDKGQLRDHCFTLAGFEVVLVLTLTLLGLVGVVLYPQLPATSWVPTIIDDLLPTGVKGLAITGIVMANMSTLDSYIHAAGLTLTHDVIKPICDANKMKIDELRWARYTTLLIGLATIAIGFTQKADDLYGFVFTSFEFTGPLLALPLLAGIMGLKASQRSFYQAAGVTLVAFVAASFLLPASQSHLAVLVGIMANGITFFGSHIIQNKALATVQHTQQGPNDNSSKK